MSKCGRQIKPCVQAGGVWTVEVAAMSVHGPAHMTVASAWRTTCGVLLKSVLKSIKFVGLNPLKYLNMEWVWELFCYLEYCLTHCIRILNRINEI